ncbi:hypothetical protein ALQ51_05485 [Pseudomonas cannabina]|uniref:Uncharacterized protein n=1 Tax=Pseudomonas cannabina TaxID=86840 RepID=A0A3M3RCK3_PSECA|nr:hypothetical protein ALQ51_05485 [Pseudomonas cannabina]
MRGGHHWNGLAGNVDGELEAAFIDGGEVCLDECFGFVADVEKNAVDAQALHLVVDRPRYDIARGQFCPFVESRHEALAVGQLEIGTFAAQRFGDQKALGLRVIEAGGVELVELQIRHPAARAPGHCDAVTARAVRVAGVQIDFCSAARGQNREARTVGVDFAAAAIEHIRAQAALAVKPETALGDQVDGGALLQQLDVRSLAGLLEQGTEYRRAGGVGGVNDASMAVTAFAGQVKLKAAFVRVPVVATGKRHALIDQPLNGLAAVLHGKAHGVFMAKAAAGVQCVFDMRLHGVAVIEDRRHAALRPECRTVGQIALAQHGNPQMPGKRQGQTQSGSAAADYQYVVLKMLTHLRILSLAATSISMGVTAQ